MCLGALSVASTLMGAISGQQQASAQSAAYEQQAAQARANAAAAEQRASNVALKGAQQEQQIRRQGESVVGKQKTGFAASNIDIASGSALDIINQTQAETIADQLQTRANTANEVWGYETQAMQEKATAQNYSSAAKNAKKAGKIALGTSLLTGAASTGSAFNQYKSTGGKGSFWQW